MRGSLFIIALAASGVSCGPHTCKEPVEQGPGATGTVEYTTGNGQTVSAKLPGRIDVSNVALGIEGTFVDANGRARDYKISLKGLSANATIDLLGHGQVCLPRQAGGDPICSDVTGTITLRTLAADCTTPVQGIYTCAESIDGSVDLTSVWEGTSFKMNATLSEVGSWQTETCTAD